MKKIIQFSRVNALVAVALFALLASFYSLPGAHSFQVYLDSKLVIDQYVNSKMEAPKLQLDPSENYRQLIVKYNECGRSVTGRKITLKDANNKVLKEWSFEGVSTGYQGSMTCSVKELTELSQKGISLKLYYSSKDFTQGQQIANLVIGSDVKTSRN